MALEKWGHYPNLRGDDPFSRGHGDSRRPQFFRHQRAQNIHHWFPEAHGAQVIFDGKPGLLVDEDESYWEIEQRNGKRCVCIHLRKDDRASFFIAERPEEG